MLSGFHEVLSLHLQQWISQLSVSPETCHLVQHCYETLREANGATRLDSWFWDDENHCLWEGFKKSRLGKIATSLSQAWKLYQELTGQQSNQLTGGSRKTEGGSSSGGYKYKKWPHWNVFWERRIKNEWVRPGYLADVAKIPARTQRQWSLKCKSRSPVLLSVYFWWNLSPMWEVFCISTTDLKSWLKSYN